MLRRYAFSFVPPQQLHHWQLNALSVNIVIEVFIEQRSIPVAGKLRLQPLTSIERIVGVTSVS